MIKNSVGSIIDLEKGSKVGNGNMEQYTQNGSTGLRHYGAGGGRFHQWVDKTDEVEGSRNI
ncbi:MAG: hypothetical protein COU30_03700 [Candidatus Magasanikbacteria bacterium CG10_big_fil_rev_8_21_14_0_10_38_6]|uniref:Uncharacterized protein n=1 Tax=Candidatus Magasanikbacteria bacterium CG10_big_fil_rev_8_21_14_0_10_38_6 TaxID=1974647 RepID=A0A2M6P0G2_9BACT|nr:hypothetical protein [bacterium]PIR77215.1 MAG: hypothetical protein COU30_03700 [Candidatus Magasanikbacteria bacterium CG10_big_fil_rev_8_21_14_0_10_38_6]